ncbi:MAG TPA: RelA/SpoT family protein [Bacteroidales bacterium]|nr:RelA/SpoT family protein [Bacteroidales bacterium]
MANEEKIIQNRYRALLRSSDKLILKGDQKLIRKALNIVINYCGSRKTITGEASVVHALSVARIVVEEMGLSISSIIGALLHDCAGNLPLTDVQIRKEFGIDTYQIIKGLSKVESIETETSAYQSENFLKLLLSLADDIRVILIKLVERIEYMRRLDGAKQEDQLKIASETYFLYAPLAHRLGLYTLKLEMEDLAMKYLDREAYDAIEQKIKQTSATRNRLIREFSLPVKEQLDRLNIKYEIESRNKSIHSIWQKIKKQGVEFEEVYDLFAFRIIIDSKPEKEKSDCWQVYSLVTDLYQPNPSRMRDWISIPKSNGYESLHTTVIGPRGRWVEVQIRTKRMDEIAEKGLAAHYRYKGAGGERGLDAWLTHMREILEMPQEEDRSVIDYVKSGLYTDEIFVFTPKGDLRRLRTGATVLDFAFDIHTQVGSTCVGGKVNGRNVGIRHLLESGDKVAIITAKNQKPKQDWLSFAVTTKARNKIRQALDDEVVKAAADGKEILLRRLKNWKKEFNDATVRLLLDHYSQPNARELYYQIAIGKIDILDIKEFLQKGERIKPGGTHQKMAVADDLQESQHLTAEERFNDFLVIEDKVEGLDYSLSRCCNPVLGDRIFGFVTITEGIKIHRISCPNAPYMLSNYPYRVVMARWIQGEESSAFRTAIRVTGVDDHAMITKIYDVISSYNVSLRNFNYENRDGMFEGTVYLFVSNINTLNGLIKKIHSIKGVLKAVRYDK